MEILQNETERQIAAKICKGNPSNRDIGLALMLVIEKMWSEERLATFVRQVHSAECANCKKAGSVKWYKRTICALLGLIGALIGLFKMYVGGNAQ